MIFFTIDPSIVSLGYAVSIDWILVDAGCIKQPSSSEHDYRTRAVWMAEELQKTVQDYCLQYDQHMTVLIEAPENWHAGKGQRSKDKGDIQKLYLSVGTDIGTLSHVDGVQEIYVVDASKWKGQTPKPIAVKRAHAYAESQCAALGKGVPHDVCDAVLLQKYGESRQMRDYTSNKFLHFYHPVVRVFERPGMAYKPKITNKKYFITDKSLT